MIPLIIWPTVYERFKEQLKEPLMMVTGIVSREEETLLVQVRDVVIPKIPKRDGQGADLRRSSKASQAHVQVAATGSNIYRSFYW